MNNKIKIFFILVMVSNRLLAESCPDGYIELDIPEQAEIIDSSSCPAGYADLGDIYNCSTNSSSAICAVFNALCSAGFQVIKTSSGLQFNLYQNKSTSPALHVKYNDTVCYGNLIEGSAANSINIKLGDSVYHLTN